MIEIAAETPDSKHTVSTQDAKPYVPVLDDKENTGKKEDIVDDPGLLYGDETNKKENEEKMKTPQLEAENHKIDIGKSKEAKLAAGREEVEEATFINKQEIKVKFLRKQLAEGGTVREYPNDAQIPAHLVGEQLFDWQAVISLNLKDGLPTQERYKKMEDKRGWSDDVRKEFLAQNFQKDGKNIFPGYWTPRGNYPSVQMNESITCRLANGETMELNEKIMYNYSTNPAYCCSVRLLKKK